jgi:hypothetical protein
MTRSYLTFLHAVIISLGLMASSLYAGESSLPDEPQAQSPTTQSVQAEVDDNTSDKVDEKRKEILADASVAIDETRKALQALNEGNTEEALAALEMATGKLELILVRDPALSLAPVDVRVVTHDLLASPDTVKAIIHDAENYLEDGEIQKARPLVANLASEIVISSTSIPLATYPAAIKAIVPLIDEGRLDEARAGLQAALNTLVVTTDEVIPLPVVRAQQLLMKAESLAENQERTVKENENLTDMLAAARVQLNMAELLGYGSKKSFMPLYEQLDMIEDKIAGGKGGKGWFDKIKQQVLELF